CSVVLCFTFYIHLFALTVDVGENVKLTCQRQVDSDAKLFWIRLVSGSFPEVLGGAFSFNHMSDQLSFVNKIPRFTTKQEPGTFSLYIKEMERSDTGLYYCVKARNFDIKFLTEKFLTVTTNFQLPPSDPVRPGDSVTLQCSVLFDSEKKTCPGDHSVYWFRAGSDEAHPSFIYAHGNNRDHCKKSPESESTQKCDYVFSKNVSSSDAGTHYCAVATCGEILFGNGTKLEIEKLEIEGNCVIVCIFSTQKCDYFFSKNVSSSDAGTHYCAVATCGEILFGNGTKLEIEGKSGIFLYNCSNCLFLFLISGCSGDEDRLTYSAPTFTRRKAGKVDRRNEKAVEKETVYSGVRAL
uniref:Ig-like domain-containing protein n=1 Tax=Echeneis naucrates TaxID=173247 RepID=A0A665WDB1_ECHNA